MNLFSFNLKVIIFILILNLNAFSEIIENIKINGNQRISNSIIKLFSNIDFNFSISNSNSFIVVIIIIYIFGFVTFSLKILSSFSLSINPFSITNSGIDFPLSKDSFTISAALSYPI